MVIAVFSNYMNYGAESSNLAALQRLADGRSFLPELDEIPTLTNPYGVLFHLPMMPLVAWTGPVSPQALTTMARLYALGLLAMVAGALVWLQETVLSRPADRRGLLLLVLLLVAFYGPFVHSYRPDLLALFFELVALGLALRSAHTPRGSALSGVLFGLAALTKANNVSVAVGVLLWQLCSRNLRGGAILLSSSVLTAGAGSAILYLLFGAKYFQNLVHAANFGIVPIRGYLSLLGYRVSDVVVVNLPFLVLAVMGLMRWTGRTGAKAALSFVLASSVVLATVAQAKIGAGVSYYYPAFFLGVIPAHEALKAWLKEDRSRGKTIVLCAMLIWFGVQGMYSLRTTAVVALNFHTLSFPKHYPYREARELVDREYPVGQVYVPDSSAVVHFYGRSPVGPWDERAFQRSVFFRRRFESSLRRAILDRGFVAAVIPGPACGSWAPAGVFREGLEELTELKAKLGRICIFGRPGGGTHR